MAKLPETMKAIIVPEYGDVDVLQLADIPFPEQKSNEVVVKVRIFKYLCFYINSTYPRAYFFYLRNIPTNMVH